MALDPLLDHAPCGFLCVNDDGTVELANRTVAAMLSIKPEALIGRHVDVFLTIPSRIFYQTNVFPTLKLQGHVEEVYIALRDTHEREVPALLNAQRRARDGRFISDWVVVAMRHRHAYENAILEARRDAEEALRRR